MKALVVSNCATAAYASGLQAVFPQWEVKGANLDVAEKWLSKEPNEAFRTFLRECDLLLLGSENEATFAEHMRGKEVLLVPYFYFRGLHPDSFHLGIGERAVPSVLKTGNLHSRLVAAAFLLGLTHEKTAAAFNGSTYERIGYFPVFEEEKSDLLKRFGRFGIDLAPAFERWCASRDFLYTYNHPKAFVFNDILIEALGGRFVGQSEREEARAALAGVPDYLEPSIRWPIYPEIAARHAMETDFLWRTGVAAGPVSLSPGEFVARSFEALAQFPDLNGDCIPGFDLCRSALPE